MSKQKRNIIICVIAIVILGIIYFAVSRPKGSETNAGAENGENAGDEENGTSDGNYIFNFPDFEAEKIAIETPDESGAFIKDGTNWVLEGHEDVGLVQIAIDQLVAYAKTLTYKETAAENLDDLASYGLDKGYTVEITGKDGEVIKYTIGGETVDGLGYYIVKEGGETIYMIGADEGKALKKSPSDLRDRQPDFVNYNNAKYITVKNADGQSYTIEPNPNGAVSKGFGEYAVTGIYSRPMALETVKLSENIGEPIYNISAVDFIDEPEEDASYGLDTPSLTIDAEDMDGNKCTILIGDDASDVTSYAKFSNRDFVVTVSKANIDKIKNADIFDMLIKSYVTTPVSGITKITIDEDRSANRSLKATFVIDSNNNLIELNDAEISTEEFADIYEKLIALSIDGEAAEEAGKIEATITIYKKDGESTTLVFHDYDTNYYAVEWDGVTEFLMGRKTLDVLFGAVEKLM